MQLSSELFERLIGPTAPPGEGGDEDSLSLVGTAAAADEGAPAATATVAVPVQAPVRPSIIMPVGARKAERRQVRRIRFGQRVKLCLEAELSMGLWDKVMLQDISVAGLSFLSDRWHELDQAVHVVIEDRAGTPLRLRCQVRRCERGGMGGVCFTVGVTFEALLSDVPGGVAAETPVAAAAVQALPVREASESRGLLRRLKPSWLLSAFARNYDDYSTVTLGRPPRT